MIVNINVSKLHTRKLAFAVLLKLSTLIVSSAEPRALVIPRRMSFHLCLSPWDKEVHDSYPYKEQHPKKIQQCWQ